MIPLRSVLDVGVVRKMACATKMQPSILEPAGMIQFSMRHVLFFFVGHTNQRCCPVLFRTFRPPLHTLINVAMDFERASNMLLSAQERNDTVAMEFYEAVRQSYVLEQARFATSKVPHNE